MKVDRRLVCGAVLLAAAGCRTAGPSVVAPAATPAPVPVATPEPAEPVPVAPGGLPGPVAAAPTGDVTVRVLLSMRSVATFPQPGRVYTLIAGERRSVVRGGLEVDARGGTAAFQVGAYADDENAAAVALRLRASEIGSEVRVGPKGLHRVIATGRDGEGADRLRERLAEAGFARVLSVAAGTGEVVVTPSSGEPVRAPVVAVLPHDDYPVDVDGRLYRGRFALRSDPEGVAVINVLPLETYLRGVVPAEMGPHAFPEIEALKAQAVAARTYAVAHLGDHADEGYDLCDTPACQVYGGVGVEHPLTDRAVAETRGEVLLHDGAPIDALYHSTCGGRTENGDNVFSGRNVGYLEGVACRVPSTPAFEPTGPWIGPVERLAEVGEAAAVSLSVAPTAVGLAEALSGRRAEGDPVGLARAFGLLPAISTLERPAGGVSDGDVLELLRIFRIELPPADMSLRRDRWDLALVTRLAQLSGRLRPVAGTLEWSRPPRAFRADRSDESWALTGTEPLAERNSDAWRRVRGVPEPGAHGSLWLLGGAPLMLEVEAADDADGRSAWSWWVRDLALRDVASRVGVKDLESVEVVARGTSGRAVTVRLRGAGGSRTMRGFDVRRALELPDSLFVVVPRRRADGLVTLRFLGRGWGHGVGLCQNGAYGLARAGLDHVRILETYYTGVEIGTVEDVTGEGGHP